MSMARYSARLWRAVGGLAVVVALSSCSWMTYFAVSNRSAEPIHLMIEGSLYTNPQTSQTECTLDQAALRLASTPLSRWRSTDWQPLTAQRLKADASHCRWTLTLAPGESISLAQSLNYTGHQPETGAPEGLAMLGIETRLGSASFRGGEITRLFEKFSNTLYVYEYHS